MSAARPQLAPALAQPNLNGRSPLAHLLHALNQPLTGLQCSMELAVAGPRPKDQYVRTLREGLDLVARIRLLVEALREVAELQACSLGESSVTQFDHALQDVLHELQPVAEARNIGLNAAIAAGLEVRADVHITALIFRFLDSILSLACGASDLQVTAAPERNSACLTVSWICDAPPEHSPFSRPELGLLIAQAGWEQIDAKCMQSQNGRECLWQVRIPLASAAHSENQIENGDLK